MSDTFEKQLYDLLISYRSWMSLKDIADELNLDYGSNFHNSHARRKITEAISDINNSGSFEKLIIHSSYGVKIATEKEAVKYIHSRYAEIFKQLKQTRMLECKAGLDSQITTEQRIVRSFV